jgi:hypothetical protein
LKRVIGFEPNLSKVLAKCLAGAPSCEIRAIPRQNLARPGSGIVPQGPAKTRDSLDSTGRMRDGPYLLPPESND